MTNLQEQEETIVSNFIGIPYKHRGRSRSGMDCWGLIIAIYTMRGVKILDDIPYTERWSTEGYNHILENYWRQWERTSEKRFMDCVLFHNLYGVPNHIGVLLTEDRFIHCCKLGVIVSKLQDEQFAKKIVGYYRLKETAR